MEGRGRGRGKGEGEGEVAQHMEDTEGNQRNSQRRGWWERFLKQAWEQHTQGMQAILTAGPPEAGRADLQGEVCGIPCGGADI